MGLKWGCAGVTPIHVDAVWRWVWCWRECLPPSRAVMWPRHRPRHQCLAPSCAVGFAKESRREAKYVYFGALYTCLLTSGRANPLLPGALVGFFPLGAQDNATGSVSFKRLPQPPKSKGVPPHPLPPPLPTVDRFSVDRFTVDRSPLTVGRFR